MYTLFRGTWHMPSIGNKVKHWDKVPDDWECIQCKKTKHDDVNFFVHICTDGFASVRLICNTCAGKGYTTGLKRGGFRSRALPKMKLSTKQRIDKYFEEKKHDY